MKHPDFCAHSVKLTAPSAMKKKTK